MKNLLSIQDYIRWAAKQFEANQLFFGHGTDNAIDEAAFLLAHALNLGLPISQELMSKQLSETEKKQVFDIIQERIRTRKPAAYLTNYMWFAGYRFAVNEHVLVPRSPIAELIGQEFSPWVNIQKVSRILDLCTGSGCIAIASAMVCEQAKVTASDIDKRALAVAKQNIKNFSLHDRVELLESDLFEQLAEVKYDLIISNPPYVSEQEWQQLPSEYKQEPKIGLCAEHQGLAIVERILMNAAKFLSKAGILIVEVGYSEDAFTKAFPTLPVTWISFENGGQGVFTISRELLESWQQSLAYT